MDGNSIHQKNWWAPVWRGLVDDPEGKHCRRMKNAVWLFFYFVIHADRQSGRLKRKYRTISQEMGLSAKTVRKWLKVLRENGYVKAKSNGRCLEIQIIKWKGIGEHPKQGTQSIQTGAPRVAQPGHSESEIQARNFPYFSQNSADARGAKEIIIKRDKLKKEIEEDNFYLNSFKKMDQIIKEYLEEKMKNNRASLFNT